MKYAPAERRRNAFPLVLFDGDLHSRIDVAGGCRRFAGP
jgi:hypothetical protein